MNRYLRSLGMSLREEAPMLLSTAGVVMFVSAIVLAIRATPEAVDILNDIEDELPFERKNRLIQQGRVLAPIYGPTILAGLTATALVAGSVVTQKRRYAAVSMLYGASEMTLRTWREQVHKNVSSDKFDQISSDVGKRTARGILPPGEDYVGDKVLCFDKISGRYFTIDSIESLREILIELNETMYVEMWAHVNDIYFALKLPPILYGEDIGWASEHGPIVLRTDSMLTEDNRPAVVIDFERLPQHVFSKYAHA